MEDDAARWADRRGAWWNNEGPALQCGLTPPPSQSDADGEVKPMYWSREEMPDGGYVYAESQEAADAKVAAASGEGKPV